MRQTENRAFSVLPFTWDAWPAVWQVRLAQLAEDGIHVDPRDVPAVPRSIPAEINRTCHEWDLDYLGVAYLSGAGGFWLAWSDKKPVGCVGAQDLGGAAELRRMYVMAAYRRQGIGRRLVQALIDHCRTRGVMAVELWTAADGPGRLLYGQLGFVRVDVPGPGFERVDELTGRGPGNDEIRMRLSLDHAPNSKE